MTRLAGICAFLLSTLMWTACGGGGSSGGGNGGGNPGGGGGGGGAVNPPVIVSVSAGQTASGVNISVAAPASTPTPNATLVGAHAISAFSTGDVLPQNSSATVIVAGTGLNPSMKASLSGPGDITVGALQSVTFHDQSKGISFTVVVSPTAALGARTLILQDTKNDITTFTGSLEVVP